MEKFKGICVVEIEREKISIVGINNNYLYFSESQLGSIAIKKDYQYYWTSRAGSVAL